ncbi:MAG: GerMN domain-containing protein [Clostridia bacterium]|jgi:spore germination protein GerM|nr:GerMN domain-containing protein [Clostridia bacterium]MDD4571085.1 GerMN domain-containing protein [Clostridia bacterium]
MKKTRLLAALALLLLALFILASCGDKESCLETQRTSNVRSELLVHTQMSYTIAFFPDESGTLLVPLSFPINETRDVVWVAVEKLLSGTPNNFVKDAVPEGFKLEDLYLQNSVIYIKLIGNDNEVEKINPAAFAATVNFALNSYSFDFTSLYPISILVNGKEITEGTYSFTDPNNFVKNKEAYQAQVFYSDKQAMYLVPVTIELKQRAAEDNLYLAVLNKWAAAPPDNNLISPVPNGTKVISANLKNNTLMVDLNKASISYDGGSTRENIFVQSLLWTLLPYEEITGVQLTVEGETLATLPEGTGIKTPLTVPHLYQNLNTVNTLNK